MHFHRSAALLDALDAGGTTSDAVTATAERLGVSPTHLTRTFSDHVGTTPTRYAQHLRGETARRLLADHSVLDATVALDEASPGRLHDVVVTTEAVTPGQARGGGAGLVVHHGVHASPHGPLLVATSDRGVVQLAFTATTGVEGALADLRARWPAAELRPDPDGGRTAPVAAAVTARLAGATGERPLPLLLRGTNLQLAVWRALLRIPTGSCVAYGTLALAVDRPRAVRAVASAVGRNPVAPVVPCHRVLRATGALGGYRWGEATKRRLLAVEAARALGPAPGRPSLDDQPGTPDGGAQQRASGPATLAG